MVFGMTLSLLAQLRSCGGPLSLPAPADLLTGVDSWKLLGRAPEREALLRLLNSSADGDGGCTGARRRSGHRRDLACRPRHRGRCRSRYPFPRHRREIRLRTTSCELIGHRRQPRRIAGGQTGPCLLDRTDRRPTAPRFATIRRAVTAARRRPDCGTETLSRIRQVGRRQAIAHRITHPGACRGVARPGVRRRFCRCRRGRRLRQSFVH